MIMINDPCYIRVVDLEESQRFALSESIMVAHPTVVLDVENLADEDIWTLRRFYDATEEEYEEEIDFILSMFDEAKQGNLTPIEYAYAEL